MTTEHLEQVTFVNEFRKKYPNILIFAIPNGGYRDKITAVKLKNEGVVKGVPDLFVPELRTFVEMKKIGGKLSKDQQIIINELEKHYYKCIVAYGWQDAMMKIEKVIM